MYYPYKTMIKQLFPNAIHVIDSLCKVLHKSCAELIRMFYGGMEFYMTFNKYFKIVLEVSHE